MTHLFPLRLANTNLSQLNCVFQDLYYFDDLKVDTEKLPELVTENKSFLTIKHLVKEKNKFKILAYYQVYFRLEKIE